MPTTTCPRCDGLGTICNRCGRPRTRRKPGDFGSVCCRGAQIVRCSTHVQTVHKCDVCDGVMQSRGTSLEFNVEPMNRVIACSSCLQEWRDRKAVAFDEWLQKTRPEYAHAIQVRVSEQIAQVARYVRSFPQERGESRELIAAGIERGEHLLYPVAGRLVAHVDPAKPGSDRAVAQFIERAITTGPTIRLELDDDPH